MGRELIKNGPGIRGGGMRVTQPTVLTCGGVGHKDMSREKAMVMVWTLKRGLSAAKNLQTNKKNLI